MAMEGDGKMTVVTMWTLTAVTLVFVILRTYTRVVVVCSYGIDDHVYALAFVFLLLYTTFTTISAQYGFGQNMWDIKNEDDQVKAVLNEAIGQTFAVLGMAIAKWSLGLFILRIDNQRWQRVCIWCTPPAYLWDRRIEGGFCQVNATPVSLLLSSQCSNLEYVKPRTSLKLETLVTCVLVDFFFAVFPWFLLWKLRMNRQEKILILTSMSFGVIAGACGIKRSLQVGGLSSPNYLLYVLAAVYFLF
ncbi:hypothetical protein F4818DRAFT_454079 [Hypoxylon cercidicola]|nr:hypothetical protein F4818DRAFT_454079 [Hypoxylon cercidicola]